jgi:acetyl esterase
MPRLLFPLLLSILTVATCVRADPLRIPYRTVEDRSLYAHIFAPKPGVATKSVIVVTLHGGGWTMGSPDWTFSAAERFAGMGFTAVAIEYRLALNSVSPAKALEDVCAGLDWIRSRAPSLGNGSPSVAVFGVSAGGHLAAATATVGCPSGARPDALMLWSPALDLERDRWFVKLAGGAEQAKALSPLANMRACLPPTAIIQGSEDSLTPTSAAENFCSRARLLESSCTLHVYKGVGHLLTRNLAQQEQDFDPDPDARTDAWKQLTAFVSQLVQ